jgi:diadenosine tetraphosphate (Ap4A) HIT family hydrolase
MIFSLHPQLEKDCFFIEDWPICRLVLMDDSRFPWFILVPRLNGARELVDLPETEQIRVLNEINWLSKAMQKTLKPHKLNIAALGNMVPQLHIHVIARFEEDDAWPKPVWSAEGKAVPYSKEKKSELIQQIKQAFA